MTTTISKSTILNSFNEHFFEFIDDIIGIIENNQDIKVARDFFKTVRNLNPSSILKAWYSYVYFPYKEQIDNGDISYFINKDYNNDLDVISSSKDEIIAVIDKIREPIRNMTPQNFAYCTEYIQNLSNLSKIYVSL
jgi:hypothetical protein